LKKKIDSMRLSEFLTSNAEQILQTWDEFAATVQCEGNNAGQPALRSHAAKILQAIALDLQTPQTDSAQRAKSQGHGLRDSADTAAEAHADFRRAAGFPIEAMVTEFRALRASVLRLWANSGLQGCDANGLAQLTRFNEAIDQAIAEAVGRYTQKAKRAGDLFIGILAHDIGNPLGTITMSAQLFVRSGQLSPKAAAPILNSAQRINYLIKQLADLARIQTDGTLPVLRKPGNLAEQLVKVVQESQLRHPERQFLLNKEGDFEGSWDEDRMGQVLSNLLGNATAHGSRTEPVTVSVFASAENAGFSVHNHGTPIAPQDLERIFQPLTRSCLSEGEDHWSHDGLGLGLYICRQIALAHGGSLTVTSSEREGTLFTVSMPRFAQDQACLPLLGEH
jgi:signal transduction histidine kinase